jgi:uncharacterized protein (DUF433 family)
MSTEEFQFIGVGLYTAPEASRLARVSTGRIRRWLRGYTFAIKSGSRASPPVVTSALPSINGTLTLSFLDLQEIRFVHGFLEAGVKWKTLRRVHEAAHLRLGPYPFSRGDFVTDGRSILLDLTPEIHDGAFLDLISSQTSFKSVVSPCMATLKFSEDGQASEWWPLGKDKLVVLNPRRSFGQPIVVREGVPTNILARLYKAEQSFARVARWFDVSERAVRDAVEYEDSLVAA